MAGPPLLFALVVRADDAVKTPDDLKGRKVGVSTVGSVTSWIVSEVSRQKGWGFDGIAQVPIGDDASRIAALKTKALDAAIVNLAVALNYVQRGEGRILLRFNELLKDFHVHVIFATDKAIAAKPDALARLPGGLVRHHRLHAREQGRDGRRSPRTIMQTDDATTGRDLRRADADVLRRRPFQSEGAGGARPLVRRDEDAAGRARHESSSTPKQFLPKTMTQRGIDANH